METIALIAGVVVIALGILVLIRTYLSLMDNLED